jgi:uncharacterized protein (DUF2249 family)
MTKKSVTLDVREDIRNGRSPLGSILDAANNLDPEEELIVIAPFEPVPLFGVLARMGFGHHSKPLSEGAYEVRFARTAPHSDESGSQENVVLQIEVDARGLEPPEPMVRILEALGDLPEGYRMRACTDRKPMHLYGELHSRGFIGDTLRQEDGSYVTYIRRDPR